MWRATGQNFAFNLLSYLIGASFSISISLLTEGDVTLQIFDRLWDEIEETNSHLSFAISTSIYLQDWDTAFSTQFFLGRNINQGNAVMGKQRHSMPALRGAAMVSSG